MEYPLLLLQVVESVQRLDTGGNLRSDISSFVDLVLG